jgi:hypothetical protein
MPSPVELQQQERFFILSRRSKIFLLVVAKTHAKQHVLSRQGIGEGKVNKTFSALF